MEVRGWSLELGVWKLEVGSWKLIDLILLVDGCDPPPSQRDRTMAGSGWMRARRRVGTSGALSQGHLEVNWCVKVSD